MTYQLSFVTRDKQVQTDALSFSFDSEPFEKKLNNSKSKRTTNTTSSSGGGDEGAGEEDDDDSPEPDTMHLNHINMVELEDDPSVLPSLLDVMSPYEFTSKAHSLSTEDLGKFFIH